MSESSSPVPRLFSTGARHTVLASANGIFGFGSNEAGALSMNRELTELKAEQLKLPDIEFPTPLPPSVQVSAGGDYTLFLVERKVYASGKSSDGRLGLGGGVSGVAHGRLKFGVEDQDVKLIVAGQQHAMAIADNGVDIWCWGKCNQVGIGVSGNASPLYTPVCFRVFHGLVAEVITQVAIGATHAAALCENGRVYTWGDGQAGKLGHGGTASRSEPTLLNYFTRTPDEHVVQLALGDHHSLALDRRGRVYAWGNGSYGRLGQNSLTNFSSPQQVSIAIGDKHIVSIHCSSDHCVAVTSEHLLFLWGQGSKGQLGSGSTSHALAPQQFPYTVYKFIRASCGPDYTVAVTNDSKVIAWGNGYKCRCGQPGVGNVLQPYDIPYLHNQNIYMNFKETKQIKVARKYASTWIAAGEEHSIALVQDRHGIVAWGSNKHGQLGTGQMERAHQPTVVDLSNILRVDTVIVALACGAYHSAALTELGDVFTWGQNERGQLGTKDRSERRHPVKVENLQGSKITSIACGSFYSAAVQKMPGIKPYNKLYTWGDNSVGQCGLGEFIKIQEFPQVVPLPKGCVFQELVVALGEEHMLVLGKDTMDGYPDVLSKTRLYACGRSTTGQLGLHNDMQSSVWKLTKVNVWEEWEPAKKRGITDGRIKCDSDDEEETSDFNRKSKKGLTSAPGESSTSESLYPLIKLISCSQTCSLAVVQGNNMDTVFAWGHCPGVFKQDMQPVPRVLEELRGAKLETALSSNKPVFSFTVLQIVAAKHHCLLLGEYNADANNRVVFAWGQTENGKLGVGSVADHLDNLNKKKRQTEAGTGLVSQEGKEENAVQSNVKYLIPTLVAKLSNFQTTVTSVSSFSEHCLACDKTGVVYAWGATSEGRLGVPKFGMSVSEPERVVQFQDASGKSTANPDLTSLASTSSSTSSLNFPLIDPHQKGRAQPGNPQARGGASQGRGGANGVQLSSMNGSRTIPGGSTTKRNGSFSSTHSLQSMSDASKANRSRNAVAIHLDDPLEEDESGEAKPIKYNKQYLQQMGERTREMIKPLVKEYFEKFELYNQKNRQLERQKDLLHTVIVERMRMSQGDPGSITSNHRIQSEKKARDEKEKMRKARKQEAIHNAGKRTLWQRMTGTGYVIQEEKEVEDRKDQGILYAHTSTLTPLEELIGRMYLRPCLLYQFWDIAQKAIDEKKKTLAHDAHGRIQEIKLHMSDLTFSIYDAFYDSDVRLLQVFSRLMLERHMASARTPLHVLDLDSMEWFVFSKMFRSGKIRRELANCLQNAVVKLKEYEKPTPAFTLFMFQKGQERNEDKLRTAFRKIREKGEELIQILTDDVHVQQILNALGGFGEILYKSLMKTGADKSHETFCRVLLSIMMESLLYDMPYQFAAAQRERKFHSRESESRGSGVSGTHTPAHIPADRLNTQLGQLGVYLQPNNEDGDEEVPGASSQNMVEPESMKYEYIYDSNKLVFLQLSHPRNLKEYIRGRYGLSQSVLDSAIEGKGRALTSSSQSSMVLEISDEMRAAYSNLRIYHAAMEEQIQSRMAPKGHLGSYDHDAIEFEKALYEDFLLIRSRHQRRITQMSLSSLHFLGSHINQLLPNLDVTKRGYISEQGSDLHEALINVRHDAFHVDFNVDSIQCNDCGLTHPYTHEVERKKINLNIQIGEAGYIAEDPPIEHRITTEDCLAVWSVLEEDKFHDALRQPGEDAWKTVEAILSQLSSTANKFADKFEASRYDRVKHILQEINSYSHDARRAVIYFGDHAKKAINVIGLECRRVFEEMSELSSRLKIDQMSDQTKAAVLSEINIMLNEEIQNQNKTYKELNEEFYKIESIHPHVSALDVSQERLLTPVERKLLSRTKLQRKAKVCDVFLLDAVQVEIGYFELKNRRVVLPIDWDPTLTSVLSATCLSSFCVFGCRDELQQNHIRFLCNIVFEFSSTESPDIIAFRLLHTPDADWVKTKQKHMKNRGHSKTDISHHFLRREPHILLSTQFSIEELAKEQNDSITTNFDPTGCPVEIKEVVDFRFSVAGLLEFFRSLPRPRTKLYAKRALIGSGAQQMGFSALAEEPIIKHEEKN